MQIRNQVNQPQVKSQNTNFGSLHFKWDSSKEMNKALDAIESINKKAEAKDIWQRTSNNLLEVDHTKGGIDAKGGIFKSNVLHGEKTAVEEGVVAYLEGLGHKVRTNLSPRVHLDPKSREIALEKNSWLA